MNDNATTGNSNGGDLMENEHVRELFIILLENGKDASGLNALINHVCEMENFVKRAEDKIAVMKSQLDDIKEVQDHPIKTALQKTIASLESTVAEIKTQIAEIKTQIVESCKNAVSAFKEKGIAALDKLASFFNIKSGLQAIKDNTIKANDRCEKTVAKIETFSKNYHTAGRALKNMARMAVGKQPIDAVKESGKLARTIRAPYKFQIAIQRGIRNQVDLAIRAVEKLELKAESVREGKTAEKSEKPSLLATLEKNEQKSREQFGGQKPEPGRDTPKKSKNEAEV